MFASATAAHAGAIRGQVVLPAERVEAPDGLWRVENGILPVIPRSSDARGESIVILTRTTTNKEPKTDTVTVELHDLKLSPSVIAVPMGGTLQIKNDDRVPHALAAADALQAKTTPAGSTRNERMQRPGIYPLRDDEMPHIRGWLVVTDGAVSARPDEHGAWHADVPDGRYEVQLFFRGAFVTSRTLDINAHTPDVTLTAGAHP